MCRSSAREGHIQHLGLLLCHRWDRHRFFIKFLLWHRWQVFVRNLAWSGIRVLVIEHRLSLGRDTEWPNIIIGLGRVAHITLLNFSEFDAFWFYWDDIVVWFITFTSGVELVCCAWWLGCWWLGFSFLVDFFQSTWVDIHSRWIESIIITTNRLVSH